MAVRRVVGATSREVFLVSYRSALYGSAACTITILSVILVNASSTVIQSSINSAEFSNDEASRGLSAAAEPRFL